MISELNKSWLFYLFNIFLNIYWIEYFDFGTIKIEVVRIWSFLFQNFQAPEMILTLRTLFSEVSSIAAILRNPGF